MNNTQKNKQEKEESRYLKKQFSRRNFITKLSQSLAFIGLTSTFQNVFAQDTDENAFVVWDESFELAIDFSIIAADGGRRYKKPYVAVWIENNEGEIVRTLSLWLMQGGRGPRWYPDLKRWYTREKNRSEIYGGDMVAFMSTPTRSPGEYQVIWDGKNDAEQSVAQGEYFMCIETAREHGPYDLFIEPIVTETTAFNINYPMQRDIGEISLDYRQREITEEQS